MGKYPPLLLSGQPGGPGGSGEVCGEEESGAVGAGEVAG